MMAVLKDQIDILVGLITVGTFGGGAWWRWALPRLRNRRAERQAINAVLVGRPAVPANPITGEPAQEAIPGLGDRINTMQASIGELQRASELHMEKLFEVEHEVKNNDGSSMKDSTHRLERAAERSDARQDAQDAQITRIQDQLGDVQRKVEQTLQTVAETSREALAVMTEVVRSASVSP